MPNASPEMLFLGQRRHLLRLAQTWLRAPNEQAIGLVREYRRFFAELLLALPDAALLAALTAPAGDILRSWIEAEFPELPPDQADAAIVDRIDARLTGPSSLGAHLAAAGFRHAFDLRLRPDIAEFPLPALPMLMRYWLRTPRLFREVGDAGRYRDYSIDMLSRIDAATAQGGIAGHAVLEASLSVLDIQMAFHEPGNLRTLLRLRGRLIERALDLAGPARALDRTATPAQGRRLRVGFLVRNMEPRTESFIVLAHAEHLDRRRFEIVLFTQRPPEGAFGQAVTQRFSRIVALDADPARAVEQLRAETLDIAVLGNIVCFDNRGLGRIAACRVAPVQLALAAIQPSTTGFDSVDTFVTAPATEPADVADQYTERVALLDATFNVFAYPTVDRRPGKGGTRKALGLPCGPPLFLGGASMPKLQPGLTRTWMRVLAETPDSRLVLYPFNPNWWPSYPHTALCRRLDREAREAGIDPDRVRLLPAMSMSDLIALAGEAEVFLDSFPYSGNASLMEPLAAGCPVVALDGASQRALQGPSTLRALGLDELVAADIDAYVAAARRLATDPAHRSAIAQRIREAMRNAPFFDTRRFGERFGQLLQGLHDEAAGEPARMRATA